MESSLPLTAAAGPASLSPLGRIVAVFARPTQAWAGLRERSQWWIPLLIVTAVSVATGIALYHGAMVPDILDQMERGLASGQLNQAQFDAQSRFYASGAGMAILVGVQCLFYVLLTFLISAVIWFAVGFVLGTDFRYRHGLEVATWSSLIRIPEMLLFSGIALARQTTQGIHVGFGILLPESDAPSKLMVGLGAFLDGIGPLSLWYLAVVIIGAAFISGAPRRSVAWTLGSFYVLLLALAGGLAFLTAR